MINYDKLIRKERGITQPIYLMERNEQNTKFIICGSTKNLYIVEKLTICAIEKYTCTCPDFKRRQKKCKHIYFVKERVMKYCNTNNSTFLPTNDLIHKYLNYHININNATLQKNDCDPEIKNSKCKDLSIDDNNICIICFEEMKEDDLQNSLLFTCEKRCGTHFHLQCIMMWFSQNKSTCPMCRENIEDSKLNKKRKINLNNEYINLL